ncbi:MAG: tetratricopeptide repeat protein [Cyanobacteria bacterium SZAS-4]|nr:tetratricopeptide repeat protein [Cyanobacteria bacterium SZAS-4]
MKVVWLTSIMLISTVTSALAENPEWDQATRLHNSGDCRAALSAFRRISDKNPSEPTAHYMLAQCYKNSGNTKQAITELQWIISATSDRRVKGPAESLLAQLSASGGGGGVRAAAAPQSSSDMILIRGKSVPTMAGQAHIDGAISPYSIPPGGFQPGTTIVTGGSIASQTAALQVVQRSFSRNANHG